MKTPIDIMLDKTEWVPVESPADEKSEVPFVTHTGVLEIAGTRFRVYQTSTGQRVIDGDDVEDFFFGLAGKS